MKDAPVRHAFEYLAYLAVRRLVLSLPHESVRRFGAALGAFGHRVERKHTKLALDNLARALPDLDAGERTRVVAACYRHFGSTFAEVISAFRFDADEVARRYDVTGWEHVEQAVAMDRGVLILCGHFGHWQLAIYPVSLRLGELHAVVRPPDNPHVARDVDRIRGRFGTRVVSRGGAGHRIMNLIRRKAAVGMVIDQRVPGTTGIVVPFLGLPARTTSVPAFIATRTGAPAVPFACYPADGGRYRLEFRPPIVPDGRGDAAVESLTIRYLEAISEDIRRQPELWLWMHDRWRIDS